MGSFFLLLTLVACSKPPEEKKPPPPPTLITVASVQTGAFEVTEDTLGTLESVMDPKIGAEVAGRVLKVHAFAGKSVKKGEALALIDATDLALAHQSEEAEVKRLEALLSQQDRLVERQKSLIEKGFISKNAADDTRATRDAVSEQLAAARARSGIGRRSVGKTTISAPNDGVIENQFIAPGDYVKVGDALFHLVSNQKLRAHLPFPENAAPRLSKGQTVKLSSPLAPGQHFAGKITDIRPSIGEGNRALDVLVDLDGSGLLRSGGTINASVVVAIKDAAQLVPEQSVVLRPAGKVVYVIEDNRQAQQRIVQTGTRRHGQVEILSGLTGTEIIAKDGAGFLTNGAAVAVKESPKTSATK